MENFSALATERTMYSADVSGVSSTNQAPCSNSSTMSAATCSDNRVLPAPPGPTSVIIRLSASNSLTFSISSSRPTKLVRWVGRLLGSASSDLIGGKSDGRSSMISWKIRTGRLRSFNRCSPISRTRKPSGRSRSIKL